MWRAKHFDSARHDQTVQNQFFGARRDAKTIGVSRKHRVSNVERRRMAMDEVAPSFKLGPVYEAPRPKTPGEEFFETKAPPTPRRLKSESSGESLQLTPIWQQIISYKKLPYNVNKSALFHEIGQRLVDPEWQVRQHGLKVLQDGFPIIQPEELDEFMTNRVLTGVVVNLIHSAPAVKSSAFEALLMYMKHSSDPEYVLRAVVLQTLEATDVPSNLQICAMNCLPTLLSQVLAHEKFSSGVYNTYDHDSNNSSLRVDNLRIPSRSGTPTARSPSRSRSPVNQPPRANQLSQQSLLHLISVLARKMGQITFQHCAVACLEKIKHMVGVGFFDHFLETHKPNLKRDFDVLCQVYELPNSNISDVMISPMDSLLSSADDREADVFLLDENDQQEDTDQQSSTSSFVSSSDENNKTNQNDQQQLENKPKIINGNQKVEGSYHQKSQLPKPGNHSNPKLEAHVDQSKSRQNSNLADPSSVDNDVNQVSSEKTSGALGNDTENIDSSKVLVETEIKLSEDTAIQMMVLQENEERTGHKNESDDDEESKQLKRVTFGGELIKLRTPDSDNQTTDDDNNKSYESIQICDKEMRPAPLSTIPPSERVVGHVADRFVRLDLDDNIRSRPSKPVKISPTSMEGETNGFVGGRDLTSGESDKAKHVSINKLSLPSVMSDARMKAPARNSPATPQDQSRRPGSASKGGKVRKTEMKAKKSRRPGSSHIPIPIKPALHRPKYRRFILSANARRSSPKSRASSSATYDVRDSPIPNLEGGESLTSSSESETRQRRAEQGVRSADFLPQIGIVSAEILNDVNNKDDWRQRGRGLDQLTHSLRQPDVVRFLGANDPLKTGCASLLRLLIGILNERKTPLRVLTSCLKALRALCLALPVQSLVPQLPQLVPATCQHIGGVSNISVKLEAVETIKMLLRKLRPSSIVNVLFTDQCFFSKSSKMRENSLLCLLYALMIFPSTEFNIPALTNVLVQYGCHELKKRVRQALLDTFAVLGQFSPFFVSSISDSDDSDLRFFKKAIQARLARRQLPTVSPEGLISYALQMTSSSRGPDVEWVQAGSGSVSVGSADAQFSVAPFLSSDQQHSFSNNVWGDPVNDIMVTGVPPVSFHTRDIPVFTFYSNTSKPIDMSYTDDQRFYYPSYGFPQMKGTAEDGFGRNTGAPSRGIKTWPPAQNDSKFPSSPMRPADVDHQNEEMTPLSHHKNFYSNANTSNLPNIVSSSLPDWRVPSWAENSYYYPKASNMSKWSQQDDFFNSKHYPR